MKEYLYHVPEARIGEMEEFFQHGGFDEDDWQAIESSMEAPKEFRTRKKKAERYIALAK